MSNTGTRTAIYSSDIFRTSIFSISCFHFQYSLSTRKAFNSNPIMNLWNVLHATLLPSVIAPTTLEPKKSPNWSPCWARNILSCWSSFYCWQVLPLWSLSCCNTPCISNCFMPLCAILHWCNTPMPLALLQPTSSALSWDSCTVALSAAPSTSVSTHSANPATPCQGSCSKV